MNVAIFTDNDFDKVNGVTTTLRRCCGTRRRASSRASTRLSRTGVDTPGLPRAAVRGRANPVLRRDADVPAARAALPAPRPGRSDRRRPPHDAGARSAWPRMRVARQLGVPMVGSFHTDLAAYTALLSGSRRLGALMREYMRWPYGRCARVLVPSEAHARSC